MASEGHGQQQEASEEALQGSFSVVKGGYGGRGQEWWNMGRC